MKALIAATAAALCVAVLTGCAHTTLTAENSTVPGAASTSAPVVEPSPEDTTTEDAFADTDDHEDEAEAPAVPTWDDAQSAAAVARAEGFVRAWARPDLDATTWFNGLQGYCTPAAVEGFIWTDPVLIPATEVTGPGQLLDGSATSATVLVPTDAGDQQVVLVHQDDATPWQVASLTPVDGEDPS